MGFSLTGTHVIFFIASVIVAGTISGIFMAATNNISTSLSDRGDRIREQLDTEFTIINDPSHIPSSGSDYIFYLKNIGKNRVETTNDSFHLFIDGDLIEKANYNFSEEHIYPGEVASLYIDSGGTGVGDHTLRVVGPQAIDHEFEFTI